MVRVRQPGPLHAFYGRARARRGHSGAIVPTARKLARPFLTCSAGQEDYACQQPSLTAEFRLLELRAGAPSRKDTNTGTFASRERMRAAERELAAQPESAYKRAVAAHPPSVDRLIGPIRLARTARPTRWLITVHDAEFLGPDRGLRAHACHALELR